MSFNELREQVSHVADARRQAKLAELVQQLDTGEDVEIEFDADELDLQGRASRQVQD